MLPVKCAKQFTIFYRFCFEDLLILTALILDQNLIHYRIEKACVFDLNTELSLAATFNLKNESLDLLISLITLLITPKIWLEHVLSPLWDRRAQAPRATFHRRLQTLIVKLLFYCNLFYAFLNTKRTCLFTTSRILSGNSCVYCLGMESM